MNEFIFLLGIKVDTAGHLKEAEKRAKEEKQKMVF